MLWHKVERAVHCAGDGIDGQGKVDRRHRAERSVGGKQSLAGCFPFSEDVLLIFGLLFVSSRGATVLPEGNEPLKLLRRASLERFVGRGREGFTMSHMEATAYVCVPFLARESSVLDHIRRGRRKTQREKTWAVLRKSYCKGWRDNLRSACGVIPGSPQRYEPRQNGME